MAALDPYQHDGGRPQQPAAPRPTLRVGARRPFGEAAPLGPDQPLPQSQPIPRAPSAQPAQRAAAGPVSADTVGPQLTGTRPIVVTGGASLVIRERDDDWQPEEEFSSAALKNAPPWLISAVFHMTVLIILGLVAVAIQGREQIRLNFETIYAERLGSQLEFDSPLGIEMTDAVEQPILSLSELPEVDDLFAAPTDLEIQPDGMVATSDIEAPSIGLALTGREEGAKKVLLGRYGGNALTDAAVQRGLDWLARNQFNDGSWSLAGPYDDGVPGDDNPVAATAMALLAFQGDGNTHQKGKFRENVIRGWKWLLKEQDADGDFFHEGPFNHHFYTQALCTIALCELYGMTKDYTYREPAERAVNYCLNSQSSQGGWRYSPQSDSDVSVTGWVVMALQSARMAGLAVPEDHFSRVERYLDRIARNGGSRYPYQPNRRPSLAMTAEALLCRQYIGWPRDHPRLVEGIEWITSPKNLINYNRGRDVYYWYYATQVVHHMEGKYWKRWNAVMRQALPEQQIKRGRENGSWDPQRPTLDQWAPQGGRLYVTCLSIYMLEVYYRHLPIYTKVYTDLLKSGRTDRLRASGR